MGIRGRLAGLKAVLALAATAGGCAGGGTPTLPGPADEAFVGADGQNVRCVDEAVTGSRVPQRVCRTEAEWQRLEEAGRDYARGVQGPLSAPPEG